MNLQEIYEAGVQERQPYLEKADALARLTLPELAPKGAHSGSTYAAPGTVGYAHDLPQPFSSAGTSAITNLASAMLGVLFPINLPWFEVRVHDSEAMALVEASGQRSQVDSSLAQIEKRMLEKMLAAQYHATVLEAFYRVLIEGTVVIHRLPNRKADRIIPLRSFIVRRFNGELYYLCIKEDMPNPEKPHDQLCLYTFVDYQKGEVWQQTSDKTVASKVKISHKDYIVVTTRVPTMESYATGFALRFFGTIYQINQMAFDMSRATSIAAKSVLLINPDSGFTPQDIANARSGQALIAPQGMTAEQCFQWFTANMKLGEWSWVYQAMQLEKQELAKNFALGLAQQPELQTDRQTAAAIQRLSQEIDASVGSIAQVLQVTLQRPYAESYLADELKDAKLMDKLKPIVTSGSSAMSRLAELERLIQWTDLFMQRDPAFAQQIDTMGIYKFGAKIIGVPAQDFIRQAPEMPQGPGMMPAA